jgi:hypothetical protein
MAHKHFNKFIIKRDMFKDSSLGGVRIKLMLKQNHRIENDENKRDFH